MLLALSVGAGLAIELAGHVRRRSALAATAATLARVSRAADAYAAQAGAWPAVTALLAPTERLAPPEALTDRAALAADEFAAATGTPPARDVWGWPVVLVVRPHPALGLSPGRRPFALSPGPDGDYLTRGDNLHSYEQPARPKPPRLDSPNTRPARGPAGGPS